MANGININGRPLNGQFSFAYDLGGSTADLANQSFNFLQHNNETNQAFLGQSILGTQNFLAHQLTPLSAAIADTQKQNAAMIPVALSNFSQQMSDQTAAMTNAVNTGYSTIYQNTVNTNDASKSNASQGGGSYVCTAMNERGILSDSDYILLNDFKDGYMSSSNKLKSKLIEYYRRAPQIVSMLSDAQLVRLKSKYLDDVLMLIRKNQNYMAFVEYCSMMYFALSLVETEKVAA